MHAHFFLTALFTAIYSHSLKVIHRKIYKYYARYCVILYARYNGYMKKEITWIVEDIINNLEGDITDTAQGADIKRQITRLEAVLDQIKKCDIEQVELTGATWEQSLAELNNN